LVGKILRKKFTVVFQMRWLKRTDTLRDPAHSVKAKPPRQMTGRVCTLSRWRRLAVGCIADLQSAGRSQFNGHRRCGKLPVVGVTFSLHFHAARRN
jgi:hypothetical protein